ncbi:MAG: dihydropteroate synthase [Legionellales bacterium]|nr:dihydropteroate synthase [Legionellales bacterium]
MYQKNQAFEFKSREPQLFQCGDFSLDLSRPQIMGILNINQESFCAKNRSDNLDELIAIAKKMVAEGARIIDVGAEPTNPHIEKNITAQKELDSIIPVITELRRALNVPISIDTSDPSVMIAAVKSGANLINDVRALQKEHALITAKQLNVPVCLMHMAYPFGKNHPLQFAADITSVYEFLRQRVMVCVNAGIARQQILIDPGFGGGNFGKSLHQDLALMNQLALFTQLNLPILIGVSRKSTIGAVLDLAVDERIYGSIALSLLAIHNGAKIIRTHDVKETAQALRMWQAAIEES